MSTKSFKRLKSAINFNAKGKQVIRTTFYRPVMQPTSLWAMIAVLNSLRSYELLLLPFLKFLNKDLY